MEEVFKAIYQKLIGNETFNGYVGGRIFLNTAVDKSSYPYCVYKLTGSIPNKFIGGKTIVNYTIEFAIVDNSSSAELTIKCQEEMQSVLDDCELVLSGLNHVYFGVIAHELNEDQENKIWVSITQCEGIYSK